MVKNKDHSRLRQMALDYAHGRISRSRYLRERAQFLDDLPSRSAADEPPPQSPGELVRRPSAEEATIPINLTPPKPQRRSEPPEATTPQPRRGRLLAAVIGIALVILILLMTIYPGNGEQQPAATDQDPAAGDAPEPRSVGEAAPTR
jgi:hypothetical protein